MKLLFKACMISFILLSVFLSAGCATTAAQYSFTSAGQPSSAIGFLTSKKSGSPGVSFVSFDGRGLPRAEKKTYWDPIIFPAGRELRIVVRAVYEEKNKVKASGLGTVGKVIDAAQSISAITRNVDADVMLICPPLAPGKRYQLSFSKGSGLPGSNTLILTDISTGNIVHRQEFEVSFGGYSSR